MTYQMQPTLNEHDEQSGGESYASEGMQPVSQHRVREPRHRRRTRRACDSCRKRKIKCDGEEVCSGCRSSSILCVYQKVDAESTRFVKEHIQQFDARLQKIEGLFTEFLTKFESQSQGIIRPESSRLTDAEKSAEHASSGNSTELTGAIDKGEATFSVGRRENEGGKNNKPATSSDQIQHRAKRRKYRNSRPTYADAYGELHTDEWDQLRYVGLGSTMSVMDICMPFREHINRGLEKKGYNVQNNFLGPAPSVCDASIPKSTNSSFEKTSDLCYGHLPPSTLSTVLTECFYDRMHFIIPVISQKDFEMQLVEVTSTPDRATESDFLPVLYALFALTALILPHDHPTFSDDALAAYKDVDLASFFFGLSNSCSRPNTHYGGSSKPSYPRRSLNPIIALVLQAAYLSGIGSQAEAWISIGHAVRLGQDLGLHRSGSQLGLPVLDQERRQYTWWCIYSLDRTLSTALGRPVAIRDADCDIELPQTDGSGHDCAGFVAILNLRRILGDILTTVASVRTVKAGRHVSKTHEMQTIVMGLNKELQTWATNEVPKSIKTAVDGRLGVEKSIALSGYFSALMLLYRFFVVNPHRPSALKGNEALLQCARAATNCIRITDKIVTSMPICPDLIFHTQHIFTSSILLLHCIRRSESSTFIQDALKDVELAMHYLRQLQRIWPGANKLTATVEEYIEFTLKCLEKGVNSHCAFHHDKSDFTGLELRDESGRFPSDWAQLALKRLPEPPSGSARLHADSSNKDAFRDRSSYSRPNQNAIVDLTNTIQPQSYSGSSGPNLFKFTLPQKRQASTTNNALNSASAIPSPKDRYQLYDGDDPTRSWNIGATENSFDTLLNAGMDLNSDIFFENNAPFVNEGFWDFQ